MALTQTTAAKRAPMTSTRKTALIAGVLYLVTFITSIPALFLKGPARNNIVDFMHGIGSGTSVEWGAYLDVLCALAGIGTAVVLYRVTRRQNETAGLGFVTSRVIEASMMFVGALSLLAMVTLRHDMAGATGADAASMITSGRTLLAIHEWTFLLGPGTMPGINALCLGYVMYRSRLVPRAIPIIGLIGAPLILASATATLFGVFAQTSSVASLLALPIATWELSLGLWLAIKGFKPSPIIDGMTDAGAPTTDHDLAV
jgi:hypothetical protein